MREIKFRAWNIQHKAMLDNVGIAPNRETIDWTISAGSDGTYVSPRNSVDLYHIMQFTGLRDKHGKEIWEGDVLNVINCELVGYNQNEYGESEIYEDSKGKVHYVGGGFFFDGHSAGDLPLDTFDSDALEVIGNIYENPELVGR